LEAVSSYLYVDINDRYINAVTGSKPGRFPGTGHWPDNFMASLFDCMHERPGCLCLAVNNKDAHRPFLSGRMGQAGLLVDCSDEVRYEARYLHFDRAKKKADSDAGKRLEG
jgi:hypothetical protein